MPFQSRNRSNSFRRPAFSAHLPISPSTQKNALEADAAMAFDDLGDHYQKAQKKAQNPAERSTKPPTPGASDLRRHR
jgi:hypothetical protein